MVNVLIAIFITLILIIYVTYRFFSKKKLHILYEISLLKIYIIAILLILFPQIIEFIETTFGVVNVILTILTIWILILFIIVFEMYRVIDFQRQEMTKLVREVAFLKFEIKSNSKVDKENLKNKN